MTTKSFTRKAVCIILCDERTKYLAAGAMTAVLYFGIFSGGWMAFRAVVPYPVVAIGAQALTVVLVYPVYRLVVFHATGSWLLGMVRFYIACVTVLILYIICLMILVQVAGLPVLVAQIVTILVMPVVTYPVQRSWTFRGRGSRRHKTAPVVERREDRLPQPTFGRAGDPGGDPSP